MAARRMPYSDFQMGGISTPCCSSPHFHRGHTSLRGCYSQSVIEPGRDRKIWGCLNDLAFNFGTRTPVWPYQTSLQSQCNLLLSTLLSFPLSIHSQNCISVINSSPSLSQDDSSQFSLTSISPYKFLACLILSWHLLLRGLSLTQAPLLEVESKACKRKQD